MAVEEEQAQASTPDDNLTQAPKRPRGKAQNRARFNLIHWNELPEYLRVRSHRAINSSTKSEHCQYCAGTRAHIRLPRALLGA